MKKPLPRDRFSHGRGHGVGKGFVHAIKSLCVFACRQRYIYFLRKTKQRGAQVFTTVRTAKVRPKQSKDVQLVFILKKCAPIINRRSY